MPRRNIRNVLEGAYLLLAGFFLLWNVLYMTETRLSFALQPLLPVLGVGAAVMALALQRFRPGWTALPLVLLLWMAASSALNGTLDQQWGSLGNGVIAFLAILPLPRAVQRSRVKPFLRWMIALWTACFTLQGLIALWAAFTGHAVFSLRGTWFIGLNLGDGRLCLNAYVTTGGAKMGLSILLALLGALMERKGRWLYVSCMAVQLAALALTDCRTAFIALGAAVGLCAALAIGRSQMKRPLCLLCGVMAAAACTAGIYLLLGAMMNAAAPQLPRNLENIPLTALPAHLLPEAAAEEVAAHRPIDPNDPFNGRTAIWQAAWALMQHQPRTLLTGVSAPLAKLMTNLYCAENVTLTYEHVHSIYLQTLVNWGLPGALLLLAMLAAFAGKTLRLWRRDASLWQWCLPLPALYVLICESVDCFTRLNALSPMLLWACLFAALTKAAGEETL